ncbi:adenylyl-sulfate kinase, partial [Candidatus Fermentibacteria bacterium]|nr:adenylyl-sulfate kinase [Candidatus Fermentibacteria bacterium]
MTESGNGNPGRNVMWHHHPVGREDREILLGSRGVTVWLTGLPSSGKSTVAGALARALHDR